MVRARCAIVVAPRAIAISMVAALFAIAQAGCSETTSAGTDATAKDAKRLFEDAGDGETQPLPDLGPRPDEDTGVVTAMDARADADAGIDPPDPDAGPPGMFMEMEAIDEQVNDDFTSAEALPIGSTITGVIGTPQMGVYDQDAFKFDGVAGEILEVTLTPPAGSSLQAVVEVSDEPGNYLRAMDALGAVAPITRQFYVVSSGPLVVFVNDGRNLAEPPMISGGPTFTYELELVRVMPPARSVTLPVARSPAMLGALPIFDFDATEAFSAEVFASRLDTPSDVDTILILENRSGASPVFAALHDDLDADNGITDSRIDFTPPAPGNYRLILDYYGIFGPDRSYELELRGGGTPPPPTGGLVINEVDYENPGTDNAEFVEIFNASNAAISLATVSLIFINGANDTEYRRVDLGSAGSSLAAGDYLVIAMNGVTVAPSALVIRDTATAQNGPDGVVLFDTASNTVLDAFSYEGEITAAMITGATGTFDLVEGTASTLADSDTTDETIARCPNGSDTGDADADWSISTTPTAGAANDCN